MTIPDLIVGAIVRVKPLQAIGEVRRVSPTFRRWPYLVHIPGYGERGFARDELEQLPEGTVLTAPPYGAMVP